MTDFENVDYNSTDLVDLFVRYNQTESPNFNNLREKQNKNSLKFAVTAGVSLANVSLYNVTNSGEFDFEQQQIFSVGMELEYIMAFNQKKWALFLSPNFQSYSADGKEGTHALRINYKFIELPAGLRHYFYLNDQSKIFINAGYLLVFDTTVNTITYGPSTLEISRTSNAFVGAGFSYGKFGLEIRYNTVRGLLSSYHGRTASYNATSAILSYKFL
ncbi:MAG TPA: hypothetical protein VFQ50_07510, partial [Flavobacterium sp.]|jgi:hypothetical protein|nr:hypothetical protein [Flavobacterium sp.]